jgi:hypothetical protein
MFRFIYSKIICGPCSLIKKRRALARKTRLEEETGISADRVQPSGWTLDDNNKKTSMRNVSDTMTAEEEFDEEEQRRNQRVAVPLTVTMIIIAAYIWIGSALFHNFEGWTMIQSGYFCFITLGKKIVLKRTKILILCFFLATIGFGDFVSR